MDEVSPEETPSQKVPPWLFRAILTGAVALGGLYVLGWLIAELKMLIVIVLVSFFLSFALEPAVNRMERLGIRRGVGTGIMFLALLAAVGLFLWAIGTVLADQIGDFADDAPGYINDIEDWLEDTFDIEVDAQGLLDEFQEGGAVANLATRLADNLINLGATVLQVLFQILTIALFTFYLVAEGPKLRRNICSLLPAERQRQVLSIWNLAIDKTGGYIYSRLILAVISFLVHWLVFWLVGAPFPVPMAMWVGLISQFVPVIGTYIAGALPVIIGLLDQPSTGLAMLIAIVVYQQVENYLLQPKVTAHTMEIHVTVAFGSVIVGSLLLGAVGAVLALPAAATIQAFLASYLERHEVVQELEDAEAAQHPEREPLGDRLRQLLDRVFTPK
ncbi:MAG: AI-2E family transporter [Acidimicrobiia bacterium]|nr:AI-2E family transporter [Acidimicrobiia bacterium]MYG57840.1 AI-2E family transporter [Acidimicrobiia bacterium]MYH97331.1 AI-2E family transporter [Acidimicrobiia bacterium]MYJ32011.1 AI-2E family transporter [Acidimicrobiia bacterium]